MAGITWPTGTRAQTFSIDHINREYDVHGLCSAWPRRLVELVAAEGERLKY